MQEMNIFVMFCAKVRAHQYLQIMVNIAHFKSDYVPTLINKNKKVIITSDFFYYHGKKKGSNINKNMFNNIVRNPRTYIYSISKDGKYDINEIKPTPSDNKNVLKVMEDLKLKKFKSIDAEVVLDEV